VLILDLQIQRIDRTAPGRRLVRLGRQRAVDGKCERQRRSVRSELDGMLALIAFGIEAQRVEI
jgi:hypothetical protein